MFATKKIHSYFLQKEVKIDSDKNKKIYLRTHEEFLDMRDRQKDLEKKNKFWRTI